MNIQLAPVLAVASATPMYLIAAVVGVALIFDFVNGFHDAANSIATIVATRVLTPFQAVLWAASFNFIAFLFFPLKVANEIAKVVQPSIASIGVVFAGLMGAVFWNVLTAWLGLPSSSSHALVGGLAGAAVAKGGRGAVKAESLRKIFPFIVYSPVVGLTLGFALIVIVMWLVHKFTKPKKIFKTFRGLQLVSAAAFSLGHGANDAQKTMGVIIALLVATGKMKDKATAPLWIVLSCHTAIGLGTMFGGWKIVKTMGNKLTRLDPMQGVCAETAAAATLFFASSQGIPVSTTHTITGAIVGVGSARRFSAVRWGVARRVLWAWIFTIPGSALVAALTYGAIALFT
jgi:inorganic phosphate transporter, PiT family